LGACIVAFALLRCSGDKPKHPLRDAERKLDTDSHLNWSFHQVVEDSSGLGLRFPGYLIGIEKAERGEEFLGVDGLTEEVAKAKKLPVVDEDPDAWRDQEKGAEETQRENIEEQRDMLRGILKDGKRTFVSHLVSYDSEAGPPPHIRARFLHNAYMLSTDREDYIGAWSNPTSDRHGHLQFRLYDRAESPYVNSWQALKKLERELEVRLQKERITHVFVFSMGWNTPQQESLRNFNSLFGNLLNQAVRTETGFRPIFVGVTWPSQWTYPGVSYFNKADDADEIGYTWANQLINGILLPLKEKHGFRVVVVGHSFGARLVSRAVFSGPVLSYAPREKVDLLISLQGAYSINRYLKERTQGREGAPYTDYPGRVGRVVLTWSHFDTANPVANWITGANHVGGEPGYERSMDSLYAKAFCQKEWRERVSLVYDDCSPDEILMVNASNLARFSTYDKGGHAHSDIYHPQMGSFLWELVQEFAPGPPPPPAAAAASPAHEPSSINGGKDSL
jgi:hypothetical protein